ncbi:MAG: glycosyl hydrolase, partial [Anaerohalosphaeraceae bacterium]
MKKSLTLLVLMLFAAGCSYTERFFSPQQEFSTEGKTVTVYTTASKTDLRLSKTAETEFAPADQPLESE